MNLFFTIRDNKVRFIFSIGATTRNFTPTKSLCFVGYASFVLLSYILGLTYSHAILIKTNAFLFEKSALSCYTFFPFLFKLFSFNLFNFH